MMRLLNWLRRDHESFTGFVPIDVDAILVRGLRDRSSALNAMTRLKQELKNLTRQRKAVDTHFRRLTPTGVRNIARGGSILSTYELSQAMQQTTDLEQAGTLRKEQVAAIEAKRQEIHNALAKLRAFERNQ
jgi:hypothetical protein